MALQAYATSMAAFTEGMIPNSEPGVDISRQIEGAGGLGFGKVAVQGATDRAVKASVAGGKYVGITVLDSTQPQDSYAQYATAAVRTKGPIVVMASLAVAARDPVYFVPASGALTNVSNAGANILIPNASWDTSTTGAGLAVVRLA